MWTRRKIIALAAVGGVILGWVGVRVATQNHASNAVDDENADYSFTLRNNDGSWNVTNFTSNIPIILLKTKWPGPVTGSKSFGSFQMEVFEPKEGKPACLTNQPAISTPVGLRLHGMVSRLFPKRSYRLKIQDDSGGGKAISFLGLPADADWVLQGPWLDKSLIRNAFSYDLARAMGCSAMRTRVCEVFLSTTGKPVTEADYIGVYQLTELIERAKKRVNIAKLAPEQTSEPEISGGYLMAWDVGQGRYLPSWNSIQLKAPKAPSRQQVAWIDQAMTRFDRALKSPDYRDPENGYAAHIDVDAWVNYILFEELVFNLDGYTRSFYFYKDRGERLRPGPVWDHDLAMGHQFPDGTRFTRWWYIDRNAPHRWVPRLVSDPAFSEKMRQRWNTLRQGVLSDAQLDSRIDTYAAPLLSGAADRNFQRWRILNIESPFQRAKYITFATKTYPEQLAELKRFLHQRAKWMDENLKI